MSTSTDHFDEFEPHSQYKQLILKTYFEAWGRKLLLRPRAGSVVLFVDACAGRGMDDVGNHGSPVIAAKAAASAQAQLRNEFKRDVRIQVIAIEKKKSNYEALVDNLRPFGDLARALRGDFAEHVPAIVREFAGVPTLWFIDPFGIEALDSSILRQAIAEPKSEALIMFLDRGALRHFGVAVAPETRVERDLRAFDAALDLFPEDQAEARRTLEPKVARSRESLRVTREKAVAIMNAALERTDWQAVLARTPKPLRAERILEMYLEVIVDCGARYVTRLPVFNAEGDHVYYLVHAAKNGKARLTMKEAVEYALKHGPLPGDIVALLRAKLSCDLEGVEQFILARLVDKRVRWAPDQDDRNALCVRNLVLEETEIHLGQIPALKARLSRFRVPGERSMVYQFPA